MTGHELRLSRQVYRLRILGLGLGLLRIGTVFSERGASPSAWGLLAAPAWRDRTLPGTWPRSAPTRTAPSARTSSSTPGGALFFFDVPAA